MANYPIGNYLPKHPEFYADMAWDKADVPVFTLPDWRGRDTNIAEGYFEGLVRSGGVNLRYDTHPVALIQMLKPLRCFRHIHEERLCRLVVDCAVGRQGGGDPDYYGTKRNLLHAIECDPDATTENVAIVGGVSCIACDGLAHPPKQNHNGHWFEERKRFSPLCATQRSNFALFPEEPYPLLCPSCWRYAGVMHGAEWGHSNEQTYALAGLHRLMVRLASETFGKKFKTKSARQTN